jgi:signal transduction histidine kinase
MNDKTFLDINQTDEFLKDLLNIALKEMMSVINAECGSLFLFDSLRNELVLDSFYNSASLQLAGLRQKIGEGVAGKVLGIKTPVLVKDIAQDSRFQRNGFRHYRTNSFISLPLSTSKGIAGLINLADKSSGEAFSEKDLEFATSISKYACFSIDILQNSLNLRRESERYASVGKLAAGVVHEINNPLDGVIRYTNILINQIENNSVSQEYLLEAKKGLNRIANITKSLLEFSRQLNAPASKVNKYVDLGRLIDESLEFLSDKANDGTHVHKRYKENLPKVMDLGISHVVVNILKNAFDAMPNGGVLEISTDINGSHLEMNFKDTGMGILPEVQEQIFEPFFSTKSIDKGTGLGLAISNEIVNKYGGRIVVKSSTGEGSTFTVMIPKKYLENAQS